MTIFQEEPMGVIYPETWQRGINDREHQAKDYLTRIEALKVDLRHNGFNLAADLVEAGAIAVMQTLGRKAEAKF